MTPRLSRRDLLRTLAIGAGAASVSGGLVGPSVRRAHAGPAGGPPRRLFFVYVPNGCTSHDDYAVPGTSPTNFTLGQFLQPLESLRSDLVILDNLDYVTTASADVHYSGFAQALTGLEPTELVAHKQGRSLHISVDQYLADKVGKLATPSWPSIVHGAQTNARSNSFAADGTMLPPNINPYDVYQKMFASLTVGAGSSVDPAIIGQLARKKSVLDSVAADLSAFTPTLGAEDRARAEAQLASIRTLEQQLAAPMASGASCTKPASPTPAGLDLKAGSSFPQIAAMQFDLIVNAFACDLTRIAALVLHAQVSQPEFTCGYAPVNQGGTDFHGLSHDNPHDNYVSFRRGKTAKFALIADAAAKLKKIPEGSGSMLDNTIIVAFTEIGRGHSNRALDFVTIGGKNMGVKTGQYLRFGGAYPLNPNGPGTGIPHNRFLVSLIQAMGLSDQTFGDTAATGTGPIPGFRA
ncbi:MAG: DUF1552 domain-containing protein [Polyangiales bacterium]